MQSSACTKFLLPNKKGVYGFELKKYTLPKHKVLRFTVTGRNGRMVANLENSLTELKTVHFHF